MLLSDQGVNAIYNGALVDGGDLGVQVWDSLTGGNKVYDETFSAAIVNGSWNVMLGETSTLDLDYGGTYYKDYEIDGTDLDFTNNVGSVVERVAFMSPLGMVNSSKITGIPAQPNIDGANITTGSVGWDRMPAGTLNKTYGDTLYALVGSYVTSVGANSPLSSSGGVNPTISLAASCSSGQILKNQTGGWSCANDDGSVTGDVYLNITALQGNVTILWTNATAQDARIKITEDKFGTLTNGQWCTGTATGFQCTSTGTGTATD
ncbi:MAG: hypothetical protein V1875_05765, partial [Candidatus Altiarchaeota archaeon]